jgi:Uma2 family endonuclease
VRELDCPLRPARPPTVDELLTDDGVPMESERHRRQMELLIECLELAWAERRDFYAGGDMFVYYSVDQLRTEDFRGPDVFVVLGTERRERKAWVVWEEGGKRPDVVIELTSETTAAIDRGKKKRIYGEVLGVPEYFIYDPASGELEGWRLDSEALAYERMAVLPSGRLPSRRLGLELGVWQGRHADADPPWGGEGRFPI